MTTTDPKKLSAYRQVKAALTRRNLVRATSCTACGATPAPAKDGRSRIHAHHHRGYDYPLDVVWLCAHCHAAVTPQPSGESNHNAKISDAEADEIRTSRDTPTRLARRFGLSRRYVHQIRAGQWRKPDRALSHKEAQGDASPHEFRPHPKFPWFCDQCGYAEHEPLQHGRALTQGGAS